MPISDGRFRRGRLVEFHLVLGLISAKASGSSRCISLARHTMYSFTPSSITPRDGDLNITRFGVHSWGTPREGHSNNHMAFATTSNDPEDIALDAIQDFIDTRIEALMPSWGHMAESMAKAEVPARIAREFN